MTTATKQGLAEQAHNRMFRIVVPAMLGLVSIGAWLFEVFVIKGWAGLNWLRGYPFAALVGIAASALATGFAAKYALDTRRHPSAGAAPFGGFVLGASLAAFVSFEVAREAIYNLHSRSAAWLSLSGEPGLARSFYITQWLLILGAGLITTSVFTLGIRRLLVAIAWWTALLFAVALLLVMPLSVALIQVIQAPGGQTDYVHAVKMGYPMFFTPILLAVATHIAVRAAAKSAPNTPSSPSEK